MGNKKKPWDSFKISSTRRGFGGFSRPGFHRFRLPWRPWHTRLGGPWSQDLRVPIRRCGLALGVHRMPCKSPSFTWENGLGHGKHMKTWQGKSSTTGDLVFFGLEKWRMTFFCGEDVVSDIKRQGTFPKPQGKMEYTVYPASTDESSCAPIISSFFGTFGVVSTCSDPPKICILIVNKIKYMSCICHMPWYPQYSWQMAKFHVHIWLLPGRPRRPLRPLRGSLRWSACSRACRTSLWTSAWAWKRKRPRRGTAMKLGDEFGAASFTIKNWGYRMIVYNIYIYTYTHV